MKTRNIMSGIVQNIIVIFFQFYSKIQAVSWSEICCGGKNILKLLFVLISKCLSVFISYAYNVFKSYNLQVHIINLKPIFECFQCLVTLWQYYKSQLHCYMR